MGEPPKTEPLQGEDTKPDTKTEEDKPTKALKKKPKISFTECLVNKDQKSRFEYCSKNYGFDPSALEFCKKDYCGNCCDGVVDAMHKV